MVQDKPRRLACDRCHAQKLRCSRAVDPEKNQPDKPCSRCRKADAPCVVSERGKIGRPAKVNKRKTSPGLTRFHSPRSSVSSSYNLSPMPADPASFTPRYSSVSGLSPLRSDEHMMCGPDYTAFYDAAGTAIITPITQLNNAVFGMPSACPDGSSEANGGWVSHSTWSNTTLHPTWAPRTLAADMLEVTPDMPYLIKADPSVASREQAMHHSMPASISESTPPTSPKTTGTSSTTYFYKLTALNAKILQFHENYRNIPMLGDVGFVSNITIEMVEFSCELIKIALQIMPDNYTLGLGIDLSVSDASSVPSLEDDSRLSSRNPSVDDFSMFEAEQTPSIPQSSTIFLLLGCYTQLLHSFEFTVNSLYKRHTKNNQLDITMWKYPGTVGSLLKASLVIDTVTYLLDSVHRAFSGVRPDAPDLASFAKASECSAWKGFFWGLNKSFAKDNLLTQAFVEIQEREQCVMRKAQRLKQAIGQSEI
ncbi:hypothetical protein S40285_10651 [Stachybotrys chlorohalonatus IBT 40285]|uniref:Zn(2)-C6 fungal-type domain-containing protein n=1 Tax=Stachybotrys chlorohalonatus (strain IBT 40285) TaxID=1283841 RepID=A0A084QZA4_STAC4|nr:hypothetical protein S40285_10651 [Stachybotrys chlorohalonata IBT 40285]